MVESPEPEVCALCRNGERVKIHAPCIINLSTDQIAELSVYNPDPDEIGEVSTELKRDISLFLVTQVPISCEIRKTNSVKQHFPRRRKGLIPGTSVITADGSSPVLIKTVM